MGVLFSCPADDYDPLDLQEEAPAPTTSSTAGAGEPAPAILRARSSSAPGRSGSASTARSAKRLQPTRSRVARSFSAISSPPRRAGHGPASSSRSASPRWPLPACGRCRIHRRECARELELEFPDGGSGPRLCRLSLCCAASGGPRWCSQAGEREAKLGHSFPWASSGELRSEERGDVFLRCLWAGSQTAS